MTDDHPPDWLTAELAAASDGGPSFTAACHAAADLSVAVLKLRRAGSNARPVLCPVADLVRALAATAAVSPEPVLRWAGLAAADPNGRDYAAGWGRLASALRLDPTQALRHLRLTVADELGDGFAPAAARFRGAAAGAADGWDEAFARTTADWAAAARDRLFEAEGAFRDGYRTAEAYEG